jgi:hypothetical protein
MDTEDGCLILTENGGRDEWIKCKKTAEERYVKFMRNLFPLVVPKHWRVDKLYARLSAAVTRMDSAEQKPVDLFLIRQDNQNPRLNLRDTETEFLYQISLWVALNGELDPVLDEVVVIIYSRLPSCDSCYWSLFSVYLTEMFRIPRRKVHIVLRSCAFDRQPKAYTRNCDYWHEYNDGGIGWRKLNGPHEDQI